MAAEALTLRAFVVKRTVGMLATMLVVASVVFLVTNLIPGSVAAVMLGQEATVDEIRALDRQLGLDRPVLEKFAIWLGRLARGNLGVSLYQDKPVSVAIRERLEPTLLLTTFAVAIALFIGLPLGVLAAVRHRTRADLAALVVSLLGISLPGFWLGMLMILLFGLYLDVLPTAGYASLRTDPWLTLQHLVMPAIASGLAQAGLIARMSRANLLEVLRADYVRTARSKGLGERLVIGKHALRNAMIPTLSVIGVTVALSLSGAVITESVFAIPGMGRLLVEAVRRRDFPMIQGLVLVIAAGIALVNVVVDISYAWLNPVIRYD